MTLTGKILLYAGLGLAFIFILILSGGTIYTYVKYGNNTHFLDIKQYAVDTGWYLPGFYAHIFASSVILIVGFFQFRKWVYTNRVLHRTLGKIYVFGVLFISAPGAYVMTMFIHRGRGALISFLIQNTLWIFTTAMAWYYIKHVKIMPHVKMMRRSYALAFAAVTLRFYIYLFDLLGNGVNFSHNYLIIAFLSWVPNLILVELINYYDKGDYW